MKRILLTTIVAFCLSYTFAQPTAGLVAYWKMDGNFNDFGPNGINGTNFGTTATTNRTGAVNTAMAFSNPSSLVPQYATHPVNSNVNFSGTQDFSITFYTFINSPYVHTGGFHDNNLNYSGPGIWFWNNPGQPVIQFNYKNASVASLSGALPLGQWVHICCLREAGTLKIYSNGVLNNSGAEGTGVPAYAYPARFGTMFFNSNTPAPQYNGLNGKMDELRIYNRALTPAEVASMAVLPVKLTSFTATKNNSDILLQWQTEYEQNSSYFNVQRSADGINFSTITTVQAKGNSSVKSNYQYTDNTAKSLANVKTFFYRLEMIDIDARKENSGTVNVKLDTDKKELTILQNPAGNDLHIQFTSSAKETGCIIITDAGGKLLFTKQIQLNTGTISTVIPVIALAAGNYYITVTSTQGKQTKAFLKQ